MSLGAPAAGSALDVLAAEARYRRERYDPYRAKMYGARPRKARLRELQRLWESAEARLEAARALRREASD